MKEFFNKNKVLIFGLVSAIALAISELIKGGQSSTKVLVFSGIIAAASFAARNLRGQWASIAGLVGNALAAYLTQLQTGNVQLAQLILQMVIGLLAVLAAPAKSEGYEKSPVITEAKREGEIITPTPLAPKPDTTI